MQTKAERAAYMRDYYLRNKEKFRRSPEQQEAYNARRRVEYANDPAVREERKWASADYRRRNPERRQLTQYGLDAYELELLTDSGCGICGADFDQPDVRRHIDHDHRSGQTRGVLCQSCNLALGHMFDDPIIVAAALRYLMRGGSRDVAA